MKSQLLGLVVAAALSPGFAAAQTDATTANDLDAVKEIHKSILSKLEAKTEAEMKIYTNTIPGAPVKYAMSLIGKCSETVRLPMVPATEKARTAVREAMVHAGLIN